MKKIFLILITGLLWCSVGNAGLNEPGTDQQCFDLFEKKKVFKKEFLPAVNKDTHIFVVYTSCRGDYKDWEWGWTQGMDVDGAHESAYKKCLFYTNPKNEKAKKEKHKFPDCFLYAVDDQIVWGQDVAVVKKIQKDLNAKFAALLAKAEEEKKPITPESIAGWDATCDKGEDFIKYVATAEGCIGIKSIGEPDKSKKKLIIHLHGDFKGTGPNKTPSYMSGYKSIAPDDANFFFMARPGHQFPGRVRSAGKWTSGDNINAHPDRVAWKKGWGSIKLITQTIYRLKEFYKPEKLIVIGFSGGAQDVSVMSGKVPDLIDVGILGGCDCFVSSRKFWIPKEFIKTIPREMLIIMISGEKDDYIDRAKAYYKIAKDKGLNVELHIVKGGHDAKVTLLGKLGKDIVKDALK
jgi:predicted esterase